MSDKAKALTVNRNAIQSVPTDTPTVIEFNNVLFDSISGFDPTTNFNYTPGNGVYTLNASIEIVGLDINNFIEICIRKNGVNIACQKGYSPANNQNVSIKVIDLDQNVDPSPGVYDITVEHNNGGNLNISNDPTKTFFKVLRTGG